MPVKRGSKVQANYVGKLEDGTVFDRSPENKPIEFTMGEGKLIPGFEQGVAGMELNDERTIVIDPVNGYGQRDESLIRKVSKSALPENFIVNNGMVLKLHLPNGSAVPAIVIDMTETDLVVDLNHPLAGKKLFFDVKIVGLE